MWSRSLFFFVSPYSRVLLSFLFRNFVFGSKLTRQSIDALKQYFKDDVSKEDWGLVVKLKKVFNIP